MRIAQLVHTLSYGDAISGEVLAFERSFQLSGIENVTFALNVHPKLTGRADKLSPDPKLMHSALREFDVVILHYSLGSPLNDLYRSLSNCTRVLIFHNLTPSHWFRGVNPRIVQDIESGERELPVLLSETDLILADSEFNASQIAELGFSAQVLPLPLDSQKWSEPANEGIRQLLKSNGCLNFVHVGRLAPNKCIEDVIKTFYFLHHKIEPKSVLWLVGIDIDTELYSFSLKRLIHELDLKESVRFTGCFADSELRALYESSSAYICMSEHEGFCVPVLEAMQFGLPVVAYAATAVPETVGEGGILCHEKRFPELAALLHEVASNESMRRGLVAAGKQRVLDFSFEKFHDRVSTLFGGGLTLKRPKDHLETEPLGGLEQVENG